MIRFFNLPFKNFSSLLSFHNDMNLSLNFIVLTFSEANVINSWRVLLYLVMVFVPKITLRTKCWKRKKFFGVNHLVTKTHAKRRRKWRHLTWLFEALKRTRKGGEGHCFKIISIKIFCKVRRTKLIFEVPAMFKTSSKFIKNDNAKK